VEQFSDPFETICRWISRAELQYENKNYWLKFINCALLVKSESQTNLPFAESCICLPARRFRLFVA